MKLSSILARLRLIPPVSPRTAALPRHRTPEARCLPGFLFSYLNAQFGVGLVVVVKLLVF
jgi:hypothetical protein